MSDWSYAALIPARSGSKGISHKNIKILNDKPLLAWSIEAALQCSRIDKVIVSTDSQEIADIAGKHGAWVPFLRPVELSGDTSSTELAMVHALDFLDTQGHKVRNLVLLQPTSPFRYQGRIEEAINLFESTGADSLLSVCEVHEFHWKNQPEILAMYDYKNRPMRQEILPEDKLYRENGSIYISNCRMLRNNNNRLGGRIVLFEMSKEESHDIDSPTDFIIVEALMKARFKNEN